MNILLTGGTGFIGRRLLKHLTSLGHSIHLLSRSQVEGYHTTCCDLSQDEIPEDIFNSIDIVFHLAGFAHDLRNNSRLDYLYKKINVDVTVRLAQLSAKAGVERFVFISSTKAGGSLASINCVTEEQRLEPDGVYGKTKREAEIRLLKISSHDGMPVTIIRPSLVYGPNMKGNLELMLASIKSGWFPPLPQTGNRKSMVHVDDLVRAIVFISIHDRAIGEIFIVTDAQPYSSREIYETMCNISNRPTSNWSVPKFLFDMVSVISPRIKYKIDKLLGDEYYSSSKLEKLGFKAQKTLSDMNETDF